MPGPRPIPLPTAEIIARHDAGTTQKALAEEYGVSPRTIRRRLYGVDKYGPVTIGVEPIRRAVEDAIKAGETWSEIGRRMGWTKRTTHSVIGDSARLKRALGLLPSRTVHNGSRYVTTNRRMRRGTALRFVVDGLQRDPVEFGL